MGRELGRDGIVLVLVLTLAGTIIWTGIAKPWEQTGAWFASYSGWKYVFFVLLTVLCWLFGLARLASLRNQ